MRLIWTLRPHPLSQSKLNTLFRKRCYCLCAEACKAPGFVSLRVPQSSFLSCRSVGQRSALVLIFPKGMECSRDRSWTNSSPDICIMVTRCVCACVSEWQPGWPIDSLCWVVVGSSQAGLALVLLHRTGLLPFFANLCRASKTRQSRVEGTLTGNAPVVRWKRRAKLYNLDANQIHTGLSGVQCKENESKMNHVLFFFPVLRMVAINCSANSWMNEDRGQHPYSKGGPIHPNSLHGQVLFLPPPRRSCFTLRWFVGQITRKVTGRFGYN